MKKLLAILLAVLLLAGCSNSAVPQTTEAPAPTQSPEEAKVLKIMIVGNSHSNDTFWLLADVFKDQMPEQELVLGIMYYSGCAVDRHIKHYTEKQAVYEYHYNVDGKWETMESVYLEDGLRHQAWDYVFMQAGRTDNDETMNQDGRRILEQIIADNVYGDTYKVCWLTTWPSPSDPTFYDPDFDPQPPSDWLTYLQKEYNNNTYKQFEKMVTLVKNSIVGDDHYDKVICAGAGVMYAYDTAGVPQLELWRDYTHLSDYGRLAAAYSFYAQFTGNTVETVNIDAVPAAIRVRRARDKGDLIVTDEMKQVLIDAANYSKENPWTVFNENG